ncbi:hypothetical protein SAMD00019534_046040 [Acytostelium subglobosum LB1]|uniref:hypothetical protein n=1 Tax=Acytostelium subglobosum LB1 TaxID=1410327 RepID=UPI000644F1CB|nr:hypothetical protein SAMD00019534_046040 [Acytostelium subglobosum LB1]GAM21429.1 hypothetical protein SAMD00019534_046040 [Acytostelium subglobosum LB1]|eukprot:XP_012755548.1 hypothetical protein SAMD00019534_046040 [Acytostelium subglobosum LB1]
MNNSYDNNYVDVVDLDDDEDDVPITPPPPPVDTIIVDTPPDPATPPSSSQRSASSTPTTSTSATTTTTTTNYSLQPRQMSLSQPTLRMKSETEQQQTKLPTLTLPKSLNKPMSLSQPSSSSTMPSLKNFKITLRNPLQPNTLLLQPSGGWLNTSSTSSTSTPKLTLSTTPLKSLQATSTTHTLTPTKTFNTSWSGGGASRLKTELKTEPSTATADIKVDWKALGNNTYEINGYNVQFPFPPYETQASMIHQILEALKRGENALLESATGTGKTLSLLCASLEWQATRQKEIYGRQLLHQQQKQQGDAVKARKKARKENNGNGVKVTSTTTFGNGDDDRDLQSDIYMPKTPVNANGKRPSNRSPPGFDPEDDDDEDPNACFEEEPPTIFFCSRTHSQVKQLTGELQKTAYRPNMVVLGSRDHYCINPALADQFSKREKCNNLLKKKQCGFHKERENAYHLVTSGMFKKGGEHQVWDMEDLMKAGREHHECPYFASRQMIAKANLVFCPYNYIIDPSIRSHFKDKFEKSVVIFDEAHNIEDALMDASSFDIKKEDLEEVVYQSLKPVLMQSLLPDEIVKSVRVLFDMGESILKWLNDKASTLTDIDFEKQANVWPGSQIIGVLESMGITRRNYKEINAALDKLSEQSDSDKKDNSGGGGGGGGGGSRMASGHLMNQVRKEMGMPPSRQSNGNKRSLVEDIISPKTFSIFETMANTFWFLFENFQYLSDFKLVVQKQSEFAPRDGMKWTHSFGIWALNPRVAFKSIAEHTHCIILTSGTLSPLSSFSSELSVSFPVTAELGNLNDIQKRVWIGTLGYGKNNIRMDATFKGSEYLEFQDALGDAILKHIQLIPDGVLVFFPSYFFQEKLHDRWKTTGLIQRLHQTKPLYVEPRSVKTFPTVLNGYNNSVKAGKGALLFSVFRGKVSEGINFSDEYARGVIIIGIPFPNIKDLRVDLKKKYNEQNQSKGLISGSAWYNLQGYRAMNQAVGRCIRHREDYGSILLIDDRFTNTNLWSNLSKWARVCIKNNKTIDKSLESLQQFFEDRKKIKPTK